MRGFLPAFAVIHLLALAACGSPTLLPSTPASAAPSMPSATPSQIAAPNLAAPTTLSSAPVPNTSTPAPTKVAPSSTEAATADSSGMPSIEHVYMIVMENKEYDSIVGRADAPFINGLVAGYALATNYTAVAHPSEPNYLALFSGSTFGVADDGVHNLSGQNLADQIEAVGMTWRVFAENVPTNCFKGVVAANGEDGQGLYARKHNPAISFTNISGSPVRCANITNLHHFDPGAANYELIIPNLCHDMHDCSVAVGDNFLKALVPGILSSGAWQENGVLFIVWDEGTTNVGGGGHVPLLVVSNLARKGFRFATAANHYSLVRTIEDAWGMPCLRLACTAKNLRDMFQ